ncbi:MAG TPA: lysophospholipid acyltransferase family protein [Roseiflexaceae bacterium]|nr:lysophospholipid acyltransferase family protein [Roseiflexaceae bacterium]
MIHDHELPAALPAIPADHWPAAQEVIYRSLVLPAAWSQFHRIWARIEGPLPHPSEAPLIVYLTHTSWWDAYMLFLISYRLLRSQFQNYIMMEEKQLRAYRFFRWCGAFSINRGPQAAERSVRYISRELQAQPGRCLWIFPQGRIGPGDQRPLRIYPGIARIARGAGGALLWPVALRYEFRGEQKPEAFIRSGTPHYIGADAPEAAVVAEVQARLTRAADALRDDLLLEDLAAYRPILAGPPGINRLWDALRDRIPGRSASGSAPQPRQRSSGR